MYLYHAFPRPRTKSVATEKQKFETKLILESILTHGLLCTPEKLEIFPDPNTEYTEKFSLLRGGQPELDHFQSRICFTLCEANELYAGIVRGLSPSEDGPEFKPGVVASHSDLFGPIAIGFNPIVARQIGIVPTSYFSPNDVFGSRFKLGGGTAPGLNYQIISRLKELREVMIVLSFIEGGISKKGYTFPYHHELEELGLNLPFDVSLLQKIKKMDAAERNELRKLFDLDREPAFNLVGFVDMMLGLFQQTDSSFNDDVLAFFQQREFRLIHHMRVGTVWYSLGNHPTFLNPLATEKKDEIKRLRSYFVKRIHDRNQESYFKRCWLLEKVDSLHIREYIDHIVAPRKSVPWVKKELGKFKLKIKVYEAENFGYRPQN